MQKISKMSNKDIAIIYGSDTGATENVAKSIHQKIGEDKADLLEVNKVSQMTLKSIVLS